MKKKDTSLGVVFPHSYNASQEKNRNIIGSRIAEARKTKGLNLASFSEKLAGFGVSVSRGAIGKWETGDTVPNAYQLVAICNALDIAGDFSYFMESYFPVLNKEGMLKLEQYKDDLIASGKYRPVPKVLGEIKYIEMPVSNLAVSAGTGAFLDEGNYEMISFPESTIPDRADFGLRVSGDSMEPVYHDGQIVWVQKCKQLSVGEVGIFIYDNEGYIKVYGEQEPDYSIAEDFVDCYGDIHRQPVLISYNQAYPPKAINPASLFQIVGRVL